MTSISSLRVDRVRPVVPEGGLRALPTVDLNKRNGAMLEAAAAASLGSPIWRARKQAEAREVLALSQIADRFRVYEVRMSTDLLVVAEMHVPVPCMEGPDQPLQVFPKALLGIKYPEAVLSESLPGTVFVQVLAPGGVWHPNVARAYGQPLCLGPRMPAGIPLREIVLLTYGALSMQTVQLDPGDAAGVLNVEAAQYWQANVDKIPLTRASVLSAAED
ncbi:MAG: hypothetical protein NTX87_15150 [Planctomycetota bacterium]|nr:hypothetical protein [Planctomycetota bacterium]